MKLKIKIILLILVFSILAFGCSGEEKAKLNADDQEQKIDKLKISESDKVLQNAFVEKATDLQVQGSGIVIKLLSDDLDGIKHQRFIIKLDIDQTLLISHNIDLAARIDTLQTGDKVEFSGDYEWNSKGGVVHWTHDDPNGIHTNGWLKHKGIKYH